MSYFISRRTVYCSALCVAVWTGSAAAQGGGRITGIAERATTNWEVTAGAGSKLTTVSAGIVRSTNPVLDGYVRFGVGVRATFGSGDLKLTPAGAKNVPAGVIDTLSVAARTAMLNVSGHISVLLTNRLEAGFNIDLAGVSAGSDRTATYRASATAAPTSVTAAPTTSNVFLYGSKDRGSLNSEFFAAWRATERLTVRGGLSHQLVEYKTSRVLTSNTDRFRQYSNLVFVGLRIAR